MNKLEIVVNQLKTSLSPQGLKLLRKQERMGLTIKTILALDAYLDQKDQDILADIIYDVFTQS